MGVLSSIFSKIIPAMSTSITGKAIEKIKQQEAEKKVEQETVVPTEDLSNIQSDALKNVDVISILDGLAQKNPQKLNWKTSIVDLLKLLGLDSSLDARKKLAAELNYTGSTDDTATMNTWLIKAVMKKIAEKGGNVKDLF